MSGETEKAVSGWTTDTLKAHYDALLAEKDARYEQRFTAQEEATHQALEAADKATSKAEVAADKRFDAVNEFRGALTDQTATFIPRTEAEAALSRHAEAINKAERRLATLESNSTSAVDTVNSRRADSMRAIAAAGVVFAALAIAVSVAAILH